MPLKDCDFLTLSIININTGEKLGELGELKNFATKESEEYECDLAKSFMTNREYTMTFTSDETMDKEELVAAFGVDSSKLPDSYDIQFIKLAQTRKHKKNRINKKWIKRYGYKQKLCETKGWKIKTYTDGGIELVK